jgi:hypothetical protein
MPSEKISWNSQGENYFLKRKILFFEKKSIENYMDFPP